MSDATVSTPSTNGSVITNASEIKALSILTGKSPEESKFHILIYCICGLFGIDLIWRFGKFLLVH